MDKIISGATQINALTEYNAGSIVSRVVLKNKGGNVTLFAFDKGEELSEHTAPFDAFCYITDGKAQVTVSGKVYEMSSGDMVLFPANEPHAIEAIGPFKMLLVMFKEGKRAISS